MEKDEEAKAGKPREGATESLGGILGLAKGSNLLLATLATAGGRSLMLFDMEAVVLPEESKALEEARDRLSALRKPFSTTLEMTMRFDAPLLWEDFKHLRNYARDIQARRGKGSRKMRHKRNRFQ